jgi:hypothetical protein
LEASLDLRLDCEAIDLPHTRQGEAIYDVNPSRHLIGLELTPANLNEPSLTPLWVYSLLKNDESLDISVAPERIRGTNGYRCLHLGTTE